MKLLETIKEYFRPELPVNEEIVDREEKFRKEDRSRKAWMMNYIKLTPGGFNDLMKLHEDYNDAEAHVWALYAASNRKRGQHKKVTVSVPVKGNVRELENMLKDALHNRDASAGIFYKTYEHNGLMIAEAVPAILTRSL